MPRTVDCLAYAVLLAASACSGGVQPVPLAPSPPPPGPSPVPGPGSTPAPPTPVTLSWRAPQTRVDGSPLTNLAGYRVRYGPAPGTYTTLLAVDSGALTEVAVSLPAPGRYWFVVTAIDVDGVESAYSNEAAAIR